MLPLGPIPTDDIYKFMAIAGISLIALSLVLLYKFTVYIFNKLFDTQDAIHEAEALVKRIEMFQPYYKELENPPTDITLAYWDYLHQARKAHELNKSRLKTMKKLKTLFISVVMSCLLLIIFGTAISCAGFKNWAKHINQNATSTPQTQK